jgi:hypothetical protein
MLSEKEYTMTQFIQDLLIKRFPGNLVKQQLDESTSNKLNFACPYCGDSEKDQTKKRGNYYFKSGTYKCYNDGCLTYATNKEFILAFASDNSLSIPSVTAVVVPKLTGSETKRGFMMEFLMKPNINSKLLNISNLAERFQLKKCIDARPESKVGKYIRSRHLLTLPVFIDTCYFDPSDSKIFIFNLDIISGKILGVSTRKIDDDAPGPRYDIKNYSEFSDKKLVSDYTDDEISKLDNINNFYNILNVRFTKPVIVTEGQFDSMFMYNSIATTGVTKSKSLLGTLLSKRNAYIFFDNDSAGKTESMKLINQGYNVFLWTKFISDVRKKYPSNRKEVNDIGDINALFQFYIDRGDPMTVPDFNELLMKYFSDSVYDLLSI